ncbi:MAG TPA: hypothetical protein ENO23_10605, partial [Alphaproteobacteria bacterium]|nr:hypothetical protein [Alphaproteobacteria bacterium]
MDWPTPRLMPPHRLTKSGFMAWLHCPRRAWLQAHRPDARGPLSPNEQIRIATGIAFGREVTRLFAGGVRIEADRGSPAAAVAETARHLERGEAAALFEPAFRHRDVLVRADVLARPGPGAGPWHLVEVKSASNSAGNDSERRRKLRKHWSDMAVQLFVLEGAGLPVERVSLAWVNAGYERSGEIDWQALVAIEDHTEAVRERAADVGDEVEEALALLDEPEMPPAEFGKTKCVEQCEFAEHCWGGEPDDSIIHLPRTREAQLADLRARGITRISEIPDHIELPRAQAAAREALRHPDVVVADPAGLAGWLATLQYPLHYLDFETW